MRPWIVFACLCLVARAAVAEVVTHARIDLNRTEFRLNADLTYDEVQTVEFTLLSPGAVQGVDRLSGTFYPDKQALEAREAWVDQPDGSRVPVPASLIVTRQSPSPANAPGFVSSMTTTVLFPQLREGSRLHVQWHRTQKVPALLGFHAAARGAFDGVATRGQEVRIIAPEGIDLKTGTRGDVTVARSVADGVQTIVATLPPRPALAGEPSTASPFDYLPLFLATSLPSGEAMGAILYKAAEGRAEVTPEIAALAARIAGDRTGLDAARAIHAWVAANIRYVAVYLNPDEGFVPHKAAEVLRAGYGDCKDYTVLMQALLAARGIAAEAVVIDWGTQYAAPPVISPYLANHEIIYLPAYDRYVNPTDRNATFDALDRRLSGKTVVHATPEGRVARTPDSAPETNRYLYRATLSLLADGTIDGEASYDMSPNAEIGARSMLAGAASMVDLAQRLLNAARDGGTGTIASSDPLDLSHPLEVRAQWRSPLAVDMSGTDALLRLPQGMDLFPPTQARPILENGGPRRAPILVDAADYSWDITLRLPPGRTVMKLPPDVSVNTAAGAYTAEYRHVPEGVRVHRHLIALHDVEPAANYAAVKTLMSAPIVDARAVIALSGAGE
jgi:hypothetical protein